MTDTIKPAVQLRRTITPYVGFLWVMLLIGLLAIGGAIKTKDWNALWLPLGAYGFFGIYVLDATRYRVSWNESGVTMRWDFGKRTILFQNITSVHYETASLSDGHYGTRPFRRIVIRGRRGDKKAFVDVSLRHFEPVDIGALLMEINKQRPDLTIPWQPVRKYLSNESLGQNPNPEQ